MGVRVWLWGAVCLGALLGWVVAQGTTPGCMPRDDSPNCKPDAVNDTTNSTSDLAVAEVTSAAAIVTKAADVTTAIVPPGGAVSGVTKADMNVTSTAAAAAAAAATVAETTAVPAPEATTGAQAAKRTTAAAVTAAGAAATTLGQVATTVAAATAATEAATEPASTAPAAPKRPPIDGVDRLDVTSYLIKPYLYEVEAPEPDANTTAPPGKQYAGFMYDMVEAVADILGLNFNITPSDGFGILEGDTWDGMIGDIVEKRANLAAAPLVVTLAREKVVDFTFPLSHFEATIIMLKRPWEKEDKKIQSLEDLVNQDENEKEEDEEVIDYGVTKDGAIYRFLKNSNDKLHKKMFEYLTEEFKSLRLQTSNNDGIQRARTNHGYAFIIEGSVADHLLRSPPCDLQVIRAGFMQRQYAFAVPQRSPLRDAVNEAIVELANSGKIDEFYEKAFGIDECGISAAWRISGVLSVLVSVVVLLVSALL